MLAQAFQHKLECLNGAPVLIQGKMLIRGMVEGGITRAVGQGRAAPGRSHDIEIGGAGLMDETGLFRQPPGCQPGRPARADCSFQPGKPGWESQPAGWKGRGWLQAAGRRIPVRTSAQAAGRAAGALPPAVWPIPRSRPRRIPCPRSESWSRSKIFSRSRFVAFAFARITSQARMAASQALSACPAVWESERRTVTKAQALPL